MLARTEDDFGNTAREQLNLTRTRKGSTETDFSGLATGSLSTG